MLQPKVLTTFLIFVPVLAACGGSSDNDTTNHSVGGTITGQDGSVTLSLNGTEETFNSSEFAFANQIQDGSAYTVDFVSADGGKTCTISNGSGSIRSANVNTVLVNCFSTPTAGQRVSKVIEDLDLNGTTDLITNITYNDATRTVSIESTYTEDGTPDEFRFGDEAITQVNSTLTFSQSGLLENFSIENTFNDGNVSIITFSYSYENGQIQSLTQTITTPNGSIEFQNQMQYEDGTLTEIVSENSGFTVTQSLEFRENKSLKTVTRSVNDTVGETTNYTWREDGQIFSILKTFPDNLETVSLSTVYDSDEILESSTYVDTRDPDFRTTNFTEHYKYDQQGKLKSISYDPLSTGTVKAIAEYEWQSGVCYPIHTFSIGEMVVPNYPFTKSSAYPAGVFARMGLCLHMTD